MGPAFPSAPNTLAEHQLIFRYGEDQRKFNLQLFGSTYSARKMLDAVIGDDKIKWLSPKILSVTTKDGPPVFITSDTLEELMEHEYTPAEEEWELPRPHSDYARWVRTGVVESLIQMAGETIGGTVTDKGQPGKAQSETDGSPTRKRTRSKGEGMVSAADLAQQLNMVPRVFRGHLRSLGIPKPGTGWVWPQDKADEILAKVKKAAK